MRSAAGALPPRRPSTPTPRTSKVAATPPTPRAGSSATALRIKRGSRAVGGVAPTYGGSMRGDIADQAPRRSVTDVRGAGNRLDTPCRRLHVDRKSVV